MERDEASRERVGRANGRLREQLAEETIDEAAERQRLALEAIARNDAVIIAEWRKFGRAPIMVNERPLSLHLALALGLLSEAERVA
jgi:hypothetical protein